MQKYRADLSCKQEDGSVCWYSDWIGGPTLSKIDGCRLDIYGEPRRTVYITGDADTFYSIPAVCKYYGVRMKGFVSSDDDGILAFYPVFYE